MHSNDATKNKANGEKNDKSQLQDQTALNKKPPKTTKLGMEIESDDDEDDMDGNNQKEEPKIFKNGSFSSSFLRNRNLFNLRLSTDTSSRLMTESNSTLPKKSPVTPYSRQTSSSDSQKSANSLQTPQLLNEWDNVSPNESQRRTNSLSSCYSIAESVIGNGSTASQSEFSYLLAFFKIVISLADFMAVNLNLNLFATQQENLFVSKYFFFPLKYPNVNDIFGLVISH